MWSWEYFSHFRLGYGSRNFRLYSVWGACALVPFCHRLGQGVLPDCGLGLQFHYNPLSQVVSKVCVVAVVLMGFGEPWGKRLTFAWFNLHWSVSPIRWGLFWVFFLLFFNAKWQSTWAKQVYRVFSSLIREGWITLCPVKPWREEDQMFLLY